MAQNKLISLTFIYESEPTVTVETLSMAKFAFWREMLEGQQDIDFADESGTDGFVNVAGQAINSLNDFVNELKENNKDNVDLCQKFEDARIELKKTIDHYTSSDDHGRSIVRWYIWSVECDSNWTILVTKQSNNE